MKKLSLTVLAMLALVAVSSAEVSTVGSIGFSTSTQNSIIGDLPVSGYLDKIEMWGENAASTSSVVVATYTSTNQSATAIDTYATVSSLAGTTPKVVRPRVIGTTTAGVDITAAATTTNSTSTMLGALYERPMIGSLTQIRITATVVAAAGNTNQFRIFYTPVQH